MIGGKTVAVVIPAYNESSQIGTVIETMPGFVDRIVIVNDLSADNTSEVVLSYASRDEYRNRAPIPEYRPEVADAGGYGRAELVLAEKRRAEDRLFIPSEVVSTAPDTDRIILIEHRKNGGVGAAIATGYKWCRDRAIDCTAVMDGDGQMDPGELESLCRPVIEENIDYVKGNRLRHPSAALVIPPIRFFGNSVLSIMTKMASGYWHVSDTQTGYKAISLRALNAIRLYDIYRRYGMPNDMLVKLNIASCTLREVEIKPVYNVGEKSKMKIGKVVVTISSMLFRNFFKRLYGKYLLRDFHPLFLLYHLSFILLLGSIPCLAAIVRAAVGAGRIGPHAVLAYLFLAVTGFLSMIFAMWMDIQDNEKLNK